MAVRGVLRTLEGGRVAFMCPGCREMHQVAVAGDTRPAWDFNGDFDCPTFSPSILVRGHRVSRDESGKWNGEWERDAEGNPVPYVCHSFVRDGQIQFLGDCTHDLARQTVPLKPFEETGA
ncbi:DUF6527 family protein [Aquamicrobium defluvii]|uniref:DUF6527 family protein n=1 Tax=Aquamicrobium defluvii TaxID=69279 RepID=UPI0004466F66|nr:DUF6527 family protein [Aquamicrobium defluvii]EZQ13778.1 ammonia monooxygenase [Halopseudomonas bauzanensis]